MYKFYPPSENSLDFCFAIYQYPLAKPLLTHHGSWQFREGIVIQLSDESGKCGRGEIAPLPWFGTETLTEALKFCQRLPSRSIDLAPILGEIPEALPCCQFAFASAYQDLFSPSPPPSFSPAQLCYLLPSDDEVEERLMILLGDGYQTFKMKIGLQAFAVEREKIQAVLQQFPPAGRLRLDANGGLTLAQARNWLTFLGDFPQVEFLEQPLPPHQFAEMLTLSPQFPTAIALDESVSSWRQLQACYRQGWRGIYVLKAAIMGYPQRLEDWLRTHPIDAVFSSVLETAIARQQVLRMASRWNHPERAVGFGTEHWFSP
ncbi:MAG: o-succinylbenzoate synthase [Microcystaceae cyanobacterium]